MPGNTWYKLGDRANDVTGDLYYRGQRIREAYYRGEQIWGEEFLGILLARLPDKLHLSVLQSENEPIDYTGIRVLGIWSHGRIEDITDKCVFNPPEGTFIDKSATSLGIIVVRVPDKTIYRAGETLDYSGVVVVAVYADGHTVDITPECVFSPANGTLVNAITLVGLLVIKLPTKTSYVAGESLDYTGVAIVAVYSNGRVVDVTSECEFVPANATVVQEGLAIEHYDL